MRLVVRALAALALPLLVAGCPGDPDIAVVQDEVFSLSCAFSSCHGSSGSGELELTDADTSLAELIDVESHEVAGEVRVIPGDSANSLLFKLLEGPVGGADQMPPSSGSVEVSVTQDQLDLVRDWIDAGAL